MKFTPKMILLLLYLFFVTMFSSQILGSISVNEITLPYVVLILFLFIVGLALILGWDYIIPLIIRNYRLGDCKVSDRKYLICRYRNSPELTGHVFIKVIPTQPIGDMQKERRDSYLQTIQGLLAGGQFEVMVAYIGMKDRYHETIIDRLKSEKQRLLTFSRKESLMVRENLERINTELKILEQVPVILEGFYIAVAREYDVDEEELKRKLEADSRALQAMLSGKIGAKAQVIKDEELRNIVNYMLFGSVVQVSM